MNLRPPSLLDEIKRSESIVPGDAYINKQNPPLSYSLEDSISTQPVNNSPSSISPTTQRQKVEIPPPSFGTFTSSLVSISESAEKIQKGSVQSTQHEFERENKRLEDLQHQECIKLLEIAEKVRSNETWDTLKRIATFVLCSASVVTGGGLIATGDSQAIKAGSCLVISGLAGIASLALQEMGANQYLVASLAIISAAFGFAGLGLSKSADVVTNLLQRIGLIVATTMHLAKGTTLTLESWTNHVIDALQAELTLIKHEIQQGTVEIRRTVENAEYSQKITDNIEAISQSLKSHNRALHQIQQIAIQG